METNQTNYLELTELSGEEVSQEQVERIFTRYSWAVQYCKDKTVLEAACGTGQGIGLLSQSAKRFIAGDFSQEILNIAVSHYKNRVPLFRLDAQVLPYKDNTFDVVLLFEALYYIPDAALFIKECRRILKPGGNILIATANKDLFDFNPSPHSYQYYGVVELNNLLESNGFSVSCFGDTPVAEVSMKQKLFRPIKKMAVSLNLVPKSMAGKKWLKKLVFGTMVPMPAEIKADEMTYTEPVSLPMDKPDKNHKVILCKADKAT